MSANAGSFLAQVLRKFFLACVLGVGVLLLVQIFFVNVSRIYPGYRVREDETAESLHERAAAALDGLNDLIGSAEPLSDVSGYLRRASDLIDAYEARCNAEGGSDCSAKAAALRERLYDERAAAIDNELLPGVTGDLEAELEAAAEEAQ